MDAVGEAEMAVVVGEAITMEAADIAMIDISGMKEEEDKDHILATETVVTIRAGEAVHRDIMVSMLIQTNTCDTSILP